MLFWLAGIVLASKIGTLVVKTLRIVNGEYKISKKKQWKSELNNRQKRVEKKSHFSKMESLDDSHTAYGDLHT